MSVRERERECVRVCDRYITSRACVYVCVCERERVCVCMRVYMCVRESERET